MDKVFLFLARMLILQCFLHWCSPDEKTRTHKLESFRRWNTENRFLKAKWDQSKKAHELSFTGRRNEDNTTFIFRHENNSVTAPFTIHLASDSKYFLAVDNNGSDLVVKKLSDTTGRKRRKGNYNFITERLSIPFTNDCDSNYVHVIESEALEGKFIKSGRSGLVSLGKKNNYGCWIRILSEAMASGK